MAGLQKAMDANTRQGAYCKVMIPTCLERLGTRGRENRPLSEYSASRPRTKNETPSDYRFLKAVDVMEKECDAYGGTALLVLKLGAR